MEFEKFSRKIKTAQSIKSAQASEKFTKRRVGSKADYFDDRWRALRAKALSRDGNVCTICNCTWDLQVHHVRYVKGGRIWDSPLSDLTTLCDGCHKKVHGILSGSDDPKSKKKSGGKPRRFVERKPRVRKVR